MDENEVSRTRRRLYLLVGVLALVAIVGHIAYYNYDSRARVRTAAGKFNIGATLLPDPVPVPAFSLRDHHGNAFTREQLLGKWTLMAFGYTSCPNVCPMLLATFGRIDALLTESDFENPPDYLFITVDPERDTPERLADFVPAFGERITGLTGEEVQITMLASHLGIERVRLENAGNLENIVPLPGEGHASHAHSDSGGGYQIDHTASILIVDPEGNWRALTSPPHDASAIAHDYRKLVKLYETTAAAP